MIHNVLGKDDRGGDDRRFGRGTASHRVVVSLPPSLPPSLRACIGSSGVLPWYPRNPRIPTRDSRSDISKLGKVTNHHYHQHHDDRL